MTTRAKQIADAIVAAIAAIDNGPAVEFDADAPTRVGAAGEVIVRDGELITEEADLGPFPTYWRMLRVGVEIYVVATAATDRNTRLDDLLSAIETALSADKTLGGVAEGLAMTRDEIGNFGDAGAETIKAALIQVDVEYQTTKPLD